MRTNITKAAWTTTATAIALFIGILIGLSATSTDANTRTIHMEPGTGYQVTTFYPNHKFTTVNYFSSGGQQVAKTGVWVAPKGDNK